MLAKVIIATLMALTGSGILLTILVGLMGAFLFALNPLVQAGALDIAEGKKLEGTMIGLLWGNNAIFSGMAPVLVGFLITSMGYGILFWYIAAMSSVAGVFAIILLFVTPRTQTLPRV
jgi:MFS family permease